MATYNPRAKLLSHAVVLVCCGAALASLMFMTITLSRRGLIPESPSRFDVTKIKVFATQTLCPQVKSFTSTEYETCIASVNEGDAAANFDRAPYVNTPDIDTILASGRPELASLVRQQAPEAYELIFAQRKPFALAIDVPTALFAPKNEAIEVGNFHALVFNYIRKGVVCVDGSCGHPVDKSDIGSIQIPLLANDARTDSSPPTGTSTIWIFGTHDESPYLISMRDGIFVAKLRDLARLKLYYGLNLHSDLLLFGLSLSGIILLLVWITMTWPQYTDYGMLTYFAVSVSLASICEHFIPTVTEASYLTTALIRAAASINVLFAMTAFATATLRLSLPTLLQRLGFFGAALVVLSIGYLLHDGIDQVPVQARRFQTAMNAAYFVLPSTICLWGALTCWRHYRACRRSDARLSQTVALRQRVEQQLLLALFLGFFNWPSANNLLLALDGKRPDPIYTAQAVTAFVALFLTMIRPSVLKLQRALTLQNELSEASRLRLLLSPRRYADWKSQARAVHILEADLSGSTRAMPELRQAMHTIMRVLKHVIAEDLMTAGYAITLTKPLGDAWIFVIEHKRKATGKESFAGLIALCREKHATYERILRRSEDIIVNTRRRDDERAGASQLGLHLRIMSVGELTFQDQISTSSLEAAARIQKELAITDGSLTVEDSDVDFIGQESHLLMRYVPKPPFAHVSIAAHASLMPDDLGESRNLVDHIKQVDPAAAGLVEVAADLRMVLIKTENRSSDAVEDRRVA